MKKEKELLVEKRTREHISTAAQNATKLIADAADRATSTIANAVLEATKLLALNAAEATKLLAEKNASDHDLLIELRTRMEGLKVDIKEMRDGHAGKIDNHETRLKVLCEWRAAVDGKEGAAERINTLEKTRSNYAVWMTGITAILSVLVGLLVYHILH